ncbi:MAG: response regulator transcription factor [Spirochaetales bacterium]|nr:response regulator transcription factor [Spirochaetales bacterium]
MRIIIVEDDSKIAQFVSKGLTEAGYQIDHESDAESAISRMVDAEYDAAVVDVMLPGMDGLSLIETVRARGVDTPILILSARRSVDDRVRGFQKGGDDYLTKPFSFSELLVRLQALIRRSSKITAPSVLELGDLRLDLLSRAVRRGENDIALQPREFSLLEYFMRNIGRVVSKTVIMEHVWNYDFDPQTNVVDVLVSRLRAKIDRDYEEKLIHTVRGVGYVLRQS